MKKDNTPILLQAPSLVLLGLLILTFIPFIGETLFNTKGEPREAVVALSMLQSGDWILPVSNGGDIPYKPPMLAWVIACFGWLNGGTVTEYISRFPSALAAIVMIMWGFVVAKKHTSTREAFYMAIVTATSFEVHRAATNCRVDMLLTMFMVCGTYALFSVFINKKRLFSWAAVLLFSGAVLTKGPVGVILPLFIMWVFALVKGEKWWKATIEAAAVAVLSLILPALWYTAAYERGGENFLNLVMEENFGRMTGTMSYESHVNPWWYNIITILAGMLPYTLFMLFASIPLIAKRNKEIKFIQRIRNIKNSPWELFMALSAIIVFIFYCFPASKRSVYLLPMYPMLAWFVVKAFMSVREKAGWTVRAFAIFIGIIGLVIPAVFFVARYAGLDVSGSTAMIVNGIRLSRLGITACVCIALAIVMSVRSLVAARKFAPEHVWLVTLVAALTIYWSYSAIYQPSILNIKSEKPVAQALLADGYGKDKKISGWMSDRLMRFYVIDFYMNDKVNHVQSPYEKNGALLITRGDLPKYKELFKRRLDYELLKEFRDPSGKSHRDILLIQPVKISRNTKITESADSLKKESNIKVIAGPDGIKMIDKTTGKSIFEKRKENERK